MANTYGSPTAYFGLTMTGWHLKSSSESTSKDTSVVKTTAGAYIAASATQFNERTEYTEVWEPDGDATTAPTVPMGNAAAAPITITGLSIAGSNTTRPTITITGHDHTGGTETDHVLSTYSATPPIPTNCFGGCDPFGGATGIDATEIQSFSWSATMDHVDAQDSGGNFLAGISKGVKLSASLSAVSDADPVVPSGWYMSTWDVQEMSEGFASCNLAGDQWVA